MTPAEAAVQVRKTLNTGANLLDEKLIASISADAGCLSSSILEEATR